VPRYFACRSFRKRCRRSDAFCKSNAQCMSNEEDYPRYCCRHRNVDPEGNEVRILNAFQAVKQALGSNPNDNFSGNSIDTNRWSVTIDPPGVGTITETNQHLEMRKTTSGASYLGLGNQVSAFGRFRCPSGFLNSSIGLLKIFTPCGSPPRISILSHLGTWAFIGTAT
jgi:hypothetical protein